MGILRRLLTPRLKKKLESRGVTLVCHRPNCDGKLESGDRIVIRYVGEAGTRYYHEKCYDDMFYEPSLSRRIIRWFRRAGKILWGRETT